jgi:hypothetical protein
VAIPDPQFRRRRDVLRPLVQVRVFLPEPARPHPVDEHAEAVVGRRGVVHAPHPESRSLRHRTSFGLPRRHRHAMPSGSMVPGPVARAVPGTVVDLAEKRHQVHGGVGEQRRQQDVVLLRRVRREQLGDLPRRPGGRPAVRQDGEPVAGRRQRGVFGAHLLDHAGQLGVRRGERVDRPFLGRGVGQHLPRQVGDEAADGRSVRLPGRHRARHHPGPLGQLLAQRPVMRAHLFVCLVNGHRHDCTPFRLPSPSSPVIRVGWQGAGCSGSGYSRFTNKNCINEDEIAHSAG